MCYYNRMKVFALIYDEFDGNPYVVAVYKDKKEAEKSLVDRMRYKINDHVSYLHESEMEYDFGKGYKKIFWKNKQNEWRINKDDEKIIREVHDKIVLDGNEQIQWKFIIDEAELF